MKADVAMQNTAINWPAILKYTGERELTFIASHSEWAEDADLHAFSYEPGDILIDAQGLVFSLANRNNRFTSPVPTEQRLSLQQVIALIKAHLSELGSCCVSKFYAPSILHAIRLVDSSPKK